MIDLLERQRLNEEISRRINMIILTIVCLILLCLGIREISSWLLNHTPSSGINIGK